jgi:hypothetical protein
MPPRPAGTAAGGAGGLATASGAIGVPGPWRQVRAFAPLRADERGPQLGMALEVLV